MITSSPWTLTYFHWAFIPYSGCVICLLHQGQKWAPQVVRRKLFSVEVRKEPQMDILMCIFWMLFSGVKKSIAVKGLFMCPLYLTLLEEIVAVIIKEGPRKQNWLVDSSSGSTWPHFKAPKDGWDGRSWEYLVGKTIGNIIPEEWILTSLTRVLHYKCAPSSIALLHANICFWAGNLQVLLNSEHGTTVCPLTYPSTDLYQS